jgi:uncharacterized membrane protein
MGLDTKVVFTIKNIVAVILLIIGLVIAIMGSWRKWKINNISKWPKTDATIVGFLLEPENTSAGRDLIRPNQIDLTIDNDAEYNPQVVYTYRVRGVQYRSTNFMYNMMDSLSALEAKQLTTGLTQGATVPVFYNPNNPSEAYIYNGTSSWWYVVIGIVLVLIAGAMGIHSVVKVQKDGTLYQKGGNWSDDSSSDMGMYGGDNSFTLPNMY